MKKIEIYGVKWAEDATGHKSSYLSFFIDDKTLLDKFSNEPKDYSILDHFLFEKLGYSGLITKYNRVVLTKVTIFEIIKELEDDLEGLDEDYRLEEDLAKVLNNSIDSVAEEFAELLSFPVDMNLSREENNLKLAIYVMKYKKDLELINLINTHFLSRDKQSLLLFLESIQPQFLEKIVKYYDFDFIKEIPLQDNLDALAEFIIDENKQKVEELIQSELNSKKEN